MTRFRLRLPLPVPLRSPRPRPRTAMLALCAALAAGGLAACGGSSSSAPAVTAAAGGPTVAISDFAFAPKSVTVKVGAAVTWINRDVTVHDIAFAGGTIARSPLLPPNSTTDAWSHTFTKVGTYTYICAIHPYMAGTVVVTP